MTFLKDTKQSAIAPVRPRSTESPRFWLILGGGSIALHLVLLLGLRWMNFRATVATASADPTPIELVELAPDAVAPATESEQTAPPVESQPAAPSAPAAPPAPAPPAPADTSIAAIPPELTQPSEPQPAPPITPPPPSPVAPPTPTATPTPPPPAPAPSSTPPTLAPTPAEPVPPSAPPEAAPTPAQPEGSPSALPNESEPSGQPEQNGSSEPGSGESQGGILEGLPPVPQYEAPPSFTATVSINPPSTDIPQQLAEPIEPSRAFLNDGSQTACRATPGVIAAWGTPVEFRVSIDRTAEDPNIGRVAQDGLTTLQRSGNDEYDALADCLLREWVFRSPDTDAAAENEAASSQVIVTMQINPQ